VVEGRPSRRSHRSYHCDEGDTSWGDPNHHLRLLAGTEYERESRHEIGFSLSASRTGSGSGGGPWSSTPYSPPPTRELVDTKRTLLTLKSFPAGGGQALPYPDSSSSWKLPRASFLEHVKCFSVDHPARVHALTFARCTLYQRCHSCSALLARFISLGTRAATGGLSGGSSRIASNSPAAAASRSITSSGANAVTASSRAVRVSRRKWLSSSDVSPSFTHFPFRPLLISQAPMAGRRLPERIRHTGCRPPDHRCLDRSQSVMTWHPPLRGRDSGKGDPPYRGGRTHSVPATC